MSSCARVYSRWAEHVSFGVTLLGNPPRSAVTFDGGSPDGSLGLRALFLQECHRRGVLFGVPMFPTYSHSEADIERTLAVVQVAFEKMEAAYNNDDIAGKLEGRRQAASSGRTHRDGRTLVDSPRPQQWPASDHLRSAPGIASLTRAPAYRPRVVGASDGRMPPSVQSQPESIEAPASALWSAARRPRCHIPSRVGFLLMGDDYVHDPVVGRAIRARRMRLETELERIGLRRPFQATVHERRG